MTRSVIVTADDFGLSVGVNEAVERAHRDGILTAASLMVAGPAAADAIARARRLPGLAVGLHLVAVEGPAVLPPDRIPALVDAAGQFPADQARLGPRYAFDPRARRQLAAEIEAQFAAFAATGLPLAHADAHKHMHMHPVVAAMLLRTGRRYGLQAVRVPAEPPGVMAMLGEQPGFGARAMYAGSSVLRAQCRAAGMVVPDQVFGLAWSGGMTPERMRRLVTALPAGITEIYTHPATYRDAAVSVLMPDYLHMAEFAALLDPEVCTALRRMRLTSYAGIVSAV